VSLARRLLRLLGDRQAARWERFGGPGPVLRWCFRHPWLVTIALASLLAVALGAVFGVPPFSPLVLVVVLVAPVAPVLRVLARIHDRWAAAESDSRSPPDHRPDPGSHDGPGRHERPEPPTDPNGAATSHDPTTPAKHDDPAGPTRRDGTPPEERPD
jgi:hypothetical protein